MGATSRRQAYQHELREKLASQGHLDKAIDLAEKMDNQTLELADIQILEKGFNARMRLVDKFLPALKSIEISGDPDNPLEIAAYELTSIERAARLTSILERGRERRAELSDNSGSAKVDEPARSTDDGREE